LAITKIVTMLRDAGEAFADEDLARVSPLMHQHLIPNGACQFAALSQGMRLRETRYYTLRADCCRYRVSNVIHQLNVSVNFRL
jgi:hypothetical protein